MTHMYLAPGGIPAEIQSLPSWVVWQMQARGEGKPAKVPVTPEGHPCDANDSRNWMSYHDAAGAVLCGDLSGIGLCPKGATSKKGKLVLLDFDNVVDPTTHVVAPEVARLIDEWRLPVEFSPSGAGLRAFAFVPPEHPWAQDKRAYRHMVHADTGRALGQVFVHGGYCTVTGHRFSDYTEVPLITAPEAQIELAAGNAPVQVDWRCLPEDATPLDGAAVEDDTELWDLLTGTMPPGARSEHILPLLSALAEQCDTEAELADRAWSTDGLREYWTSKRERGDEAAMDLALRECAMAWRQRRPPPDEEFTKIMTPAAAQTGLVELWGDITPNIGKRALVKGLLGQGAMSVWYGKSNAGKSAVVLDMSCHIALGWDWQGHRVDQGAVLYVAAEGPETIRLRVQAFRQTHRERLQGFDVPFAMLPHAPDMVHGSEGVRMVIQAVAEVLAATGVAVLLVVIDTLSRTLAGGDENSNVDMGSAVRRADQIRKATGAHVLIVHHAGKDAAKGGRGHSSLQAATDSELEVEPGLIRVTKQRDLPVGAIYGFSLDGVQVGVDEDGDAVTAPVVRSRQASAYEEFGAILSPRALALVKFLDTEERISAGGSGISEKEVREKFENEVVFELSGETKRKSWVRVRKEILEKGVFSFSNDTWIRKEVM